MTRAVLSVAAASAAIVVVDVVLAVVSRVTGSQDWWNGLPALVAMVVLGIVLGRLTPLLSAVPAIVIAAFVTSTAGFWIIHALQAAGTESRFRVIDDDTPWIILGLSVFGMWGVALGAVPRIKSAAFRTILVLCVGIVALDGAESVVARTTGIPYASFMAVQIVVYTGIGFVLRRRAARAIELAIAVAATAIVEASAGEFVALSFGGAPATPPALEAVVIPVVLLVEEALAFAGFALAGIRTKAAPQG